MAKRPFFLVVPVLLLLPALRTVVGGWATVTLDQLPDYLVAAKPSSLSFMVRQHGVTPLKGVQPTLEARAGSRAARGNVVPGSKDGQYVATFTLPAPGDWTLTIHSGWGNSKLTLLPIKVIDAGGTAPVALAEADRGRHLFVAKGCVGCHMRNEGDVGAGESIGPALTGKRYQAEFLRRFLADPAANATHTGSFRMPNLGLQSAEISSLVAFLNSERTTAAKP
jgi:mono/diheme cytochrome c family protein